MLTDFGFARRMVDLETGFVIFVSKKVVRVCFRIRLFKRKIDDFLRFFCLCSAWSAEQWALSSAIGRLLEYGKGFNFRFRMIYSPTWTSKRRYFIYYALCLYAVWYQGCWPTNKKTKRNFFNAKFRTQALNELLAKKKIQKVDLISITWLADYHKVLLTFYRKLESILPL